MGVKMRTMALFAVVSILAVNAGWADFAAAEKIVDSATGNTVEAVTCAEVQSAIDDVEREGIVRITEDCSANLVIPAGKTIGLELGNWETGYHTLTDNGGDTITVEKGATLFYSEGGSVINSASSKSVINNAGVVKLRGWNSASFEAKNDAYMFTNSGELDLIDGDYVNPAVRNTGVIRVAGGRYTDADSIKQYLVKGVSLDESTGEVKKTDFIVYPNMNDDGLSECWGIHPVGFSCKVTTEYPDYAVATGAKIWSEDESVVKVTGSAIEGWTVTIVKAGSAIVWNGSFDLFGSGGIGAAMVGYEVPETAPNDVKAIIVDVIDKLPDDITAVVQQAIQAGKSISLDLEIGNKANVAGEEKVEIAKVTGEDKVAGYFEIELALKGAGEKLTNVTDLNDKEIEVRLPASFVDDLEKVAEGYVRNYYIVRLHDGVAEKIDAQLEGRELVFKSGKFSTYAVAYVDVEVDDNVVEDGGDSSSDDINKGDDTKTPDTGVLGNGVGDGARVTMLGALVVAVVSGVVASAVIMRKRLKQNHAE